jgi:hypothetical protein
MRHPDGFGEVRQFLLLAPMTELVEGGKLPRSHVPAGLKAQLGSQFGDQTAEPVFEPISFFWE